MESATPAGEATADDLVTAAADWLQSDDGAEGLLCRLGSALRYEAGRVWVGAPDATLRAGADWFADPSVDPRPEVLRAQRVSIGRVVLAEAVRRDCRPHATARPSLGDGYGALRSTLVMPLFADSRVYGVLALYSEGDRPIGDGTLSQVGLIARAVGRRLLQRRPVFDGRLSAREIEVLGLASEGLTNQEIAERLSVSTATVKTHLTHVFAKLEVGDRAGAVAHALREGILT